MFRMIAVIAIVLASLLVPSSVANATPYCGITWGSLPKDNPTLGPGEINSLRTGQHECYDRVVIDIDGWPAGYNVQYVNEVTADGSGLPVTTPGGARLQFVVRHPSYAPHTIGQSLANVSGYRTLRSVVWAGSFEGQTTLGVGVRARLPFRVFTIPGAHGRIVLDVAHQW